MPDGSPILRSAPLLLVSVRDAEEATVALASGVDVIDVKEPARGSLGAADKDVVVSILRQVGGRAPVSMAMGELKEWRDADCRVSEPLTGLAFAKIGLAAAPADWRNRLVQWCKSLGQVGAVAAAYADATRAGAPPVDEVIDWAVEHRARGVLIDTAIKDGHGLLSHCDEGTLCRWIARTHKGGLFIAMAGSLSGESAMRVAQLGPDIVAVRGAACAGNNRAGRVDAKAIHSLKLAFTGEADDTRVRGGIAQINRQRVIGDDRRFTN